MKKEDTFKVMSTKVEVTYVDTSKKLCRHNYLLNYGHRHHHGGGNQPSPRRNRSDKVTQRTEEEGYNDMESITENTANDILTQQIAKSGWADSRSFISHYTVVGLTAVVAIFLPGLVNSDSLEKACWQPCTNIYKDIAAACQLQHFHNIL